MKYLAAAVLIMALASCEKKQCWVCTQLQYNYQAKTVDTFRSEFCDLTEKEIREKEYSRDVTYPDSVVFRKSTTCN